MKSDTKQFKAISYMKGVLEAPDSEDDTPIDVPLDSLEMLKKWNATRDERVIPTCLQTLFEQQVEALPDAIALAQGDVQLSYTSLNGAANRLARLLRARGVGPDIPVGLYMERSPLMVIALLAILKAGGAHVPLDPTYPQERLQYMIQDSQLLLLLCQDPGPLSVENIAVIRLLIDSTMDQEENSVSRPFGRDTTYILNPKDSIDFIVEQSEYLPGSHSSQASSNLNLVNVPDNLACVIYTSGSTGRPKGVQISHMGFANMSYMQRKDFGASPGDRVLQAASLGFGVSMLEIAMALTNGGTLCLPEQGRHLIGDDLWQVLENQEVTLAVLTPSALSTLACEPGLALRAMIVGGEAFPLELIRRWASQYQATYNGYGAAETTTWVLGEYCTPNQERAHIGQPIANSRTYILDQHWQPVPIGEPGELHIGGMGLARGYLNRPDFTAERFIPDPFSGLTGQRLYKTGDLARYLPDGNIEYLGRIDHQVKIRGYRVELEEIEHVLAQHPAVHSSAVIMYGEANDRHLVAYMVAAQAAQRTPELVTDILQFLDERLPAYMCPSFVEILDAWPMTPNGKIDRQALPKPDVTAKHATKESVAPRTTIEEDLVQIWKEVLKQPSIGTHDNFFDLGGHSLRAVQVLQHIRKRFTVELPLRTLFENPTIVQIGEWIEQTAQGEAGAKQAISHIVPVEREGPLLSSFDQQRLWFMDRLNPNSPFYNVMWATCLPGVYRLAELERSLNEIVRRHEILRTTFQEVEGQVIQVIAPELEITIPLVDLTSLPDAQKESQALVEARTLYAQPFDLKCAPLLRVRILNWDEQQQILLLSAHHTIFDASSVAVFAQELHTLLAAFHAKKPSPLSPLPIQYADYAVWQRQWMDSDRLPEHLAFWKEHLTGAPALLTLPTDVPRPAVQSFRGATATFRIEDKLVQDIKSISQREQVTPFITILSSFAVLLSHYSGQDDLVIGILLSNRNQAELEPLIGFLVNMLPLRFNLSDRPSFQSLLNRTRSHLLDAYLHQQVPFERLVEELNPERSLSYTPIFQVMCNEQKVIFSDQPERAELERKLIQTGLENANFELTLEIQETEQGLTCVFEYNTDLFTEETIARLAEHLPIVLRALVEHPEQHINTVRLLTAVEQQRLLYAWNDTQREYPLERLYTELFGEQVQKNPEAMAVSMGEQTLTYRELDQRSNQLARALRERGVGPDTLVALYMERSPAMLVSMLAIFKAGGAYLPLEPADPAQRLEHVLREASVTAIVTQPDLEARLALYTIPVFSLDARWKSIATYSAIAQPVQGSAENLAYAIYTSGSTGLPKGVMVTQQGMMNHLLAKVDELQLNADDSVAQTASHCFDISVWQFLAVLLAGGTVHILPDEITHDPSGLLREICVQGVTVLEIVPSLLQALLHELEGEQQIDLVLFLRWLLVTGEAFPSVLCQRWLSLYPHIPLLNAYGPTECSDDVTHAIVDPSTRLSTPIVQLGRPLPNTQIYILNPAMQPTPIGVPGELCVGGVGLARGYRNRPELTAGGFVPNPFSEIAGARLYKTGDLARYLPDGTIEYLGRIDQQVKIRGHRIELEEIEKVLSQHPTVQACLLMVYGEQAEDKQLIAYIVPAADQSVQRDIVRAYLKEHLPEYMVPSQYIRLDAFPLTPNGKIDRKALQTMLPGDGELSGSEEEYVPPETETERALAELWQRLLTLKQISVQADFFTAGGNSLLVARMATEIRKMFAVHIPITAIFQYRTIETLAEVIDQHTAGVQAVDEL